MNRRNIAKLKEHLARSTLSYNADMQLLQFKIDVLKHMEHFMLTKNKVGSSLRVKLVVVVLEDWDDRNRGGFLP